MEKFNEKIELNEIYNADSLDVIDQMIKQKMKVNAIITDPPYNISRENNFKSIGRAGLDFGDWDWDFDQTKWLKKINKIVHPGASVIIFNDWKNMGDIAKELEKQGFEIKDLIRWVKPAPMPRNTNRRYVTDAEYAIWAVYPGDKWIFNKPEDKPYLRPVLGGGVTNGKSKIHPTQKGKQAIRELIETHTEKGDIIFDPFSGSGEISINAHELGRIFVGSEIDPTFHKKSKARINDVLIKPAINHLGNKYRMISKLHSLIQVKGIDNFVDVFSGSCVVSATFKGAQKYWINDLDRDLVDIMNLLINTDKKEVIKDLDKIIKEYKLDTLPYKEGFIKLRDKYNKSKDKSVKILLTLVLFGFNQQIRFNSKGEFNIPPGKTQWTSYQRDKISTFIDSFVGKYVEVKNLDFEEFVNYVNSQTNPSKTIYYFDPPYLITDATYNSGWDQESEKRLLNTLKKLNKSKAKWILSNVLESKGLINEELSKFIKSNKYEIIDINLNYKNANYQRKEYKDKDREIIIKNF